MGIKVCKLLVLARKELAYLETLNNVRK